MGFGRAKWTTVSLSSFSILIIQSMFLFVACSDENIFILRSFVFLLKPNNRGLSLLNDVIYFQIIL